jgi:predicted DNA-binding transcriptional regulator YafY
VTKPEGGELEKIELMFSEALSPYIKTKPIHSSRVDKEKDGGLYVKIEVIPNYELEQLILSYGEGVRVLSPDYLIQKIKSRIQSSLDNYI